MRQRKFKNIGINCFTDDIRTSELITSPRTDLQDAVQQYNDVLLGLLDTHAPVNEKIVKIDHNAPWFNDDIYSARGKPRHVMHLDKDLPLPKSSSTKDLAEQIQQLLYFQD